MALLIILVAIALLINWLLGAILTFVVYRMGRWKNKAVI